MKRTILFFVLTFFAAIIILSGYGFNKEIKKAKKRDSFPDALTATVNGMQVEYMIRGVGSPVLISHGITGGIGQCLGLADMYLKPDKLKIIAVSRFGYGASSMPEKSDPAAQAEAFAALLDALKINKAVILGNSAGAAAAAQFAIKYPEKCSALILVSSNVPSTIGTAPKPVMQLFFGSDFLYWSIVKLAGKSMLLMMMSESYLKKLDDKAINGYVDEILMSGLPISRRTKGVINDMYISNLDMAKGYAFDTVKSPVLLIHAKDDPMGPFSSAEKISKIIPDCDFMVIEDGGHLLLGHEQEIKDRAEKIINRTK